MMWMGCPMWVGAIVGVVLITLLVVVIAKVLRK